MSQDIKELTRKRGAVKKRQTLFEKHFLDLQAAVTNIPFSDLDKSRIIELELRLEKFELLLQEFDKIQEQLELKSEKIEEQLPERDAFENTYFSLVANCKKFIADFYAATQPCEILQQSSCVAEAASEHSNSNNIKLPQISLPKFSGQYENWLEFRDTFDSLINSNQAISNVQKFHYLRAALEGGASQVIRSIEFSAENYKVAWETLLSRYNNESILINNHIKAIFDLPVLSRESATDLRKMIDNISKHVRSLQTLKEPVQYWDTLLIYIFSSKLDKVSAREWESKRVTLKSDSTSEHSNSRVATLHDFKEFIRGRADFLENISSSKETKQHSHSYQSTNESKSNYFCIFCKKKNHFIQSCNEFLKLSSEDKIAQIRNKKLCINCLRGVHPTKNCLAGHCKKCNKKHNTLLHNDFLQSNSSPTANENANNSTSVRTEEAKTFAGTTKTFTNKYANVFLSTALVQVKDSDGNFHTCRALLDSASQSNFITKGLCKKLKLKTNAISMTITGIGQASSNIYKQCKLTVESIHTSFSTTVSCLILPVINESLPNQTLETSELNIPSNVTLADPSFYESGNIDLLLGAELFYSLLCIGQVRLGPKLPILQKTVFGWVLSGPFHIENESSKTSCSAAFSTSIHELLSKFWEIEEVKERNENKYSEEEQLCETIFSNTTQRDKTGRFIVKIPLKQSSSILGDSRQIAEKRFYSMEAKLTKNPNLKTSYSNFLNEYLSLGHMQYIPAVPLNSYFMPHHAVQNTTSQTTKVRVVFDASCKSESGYSFNDIQCVGPVIQDDLFSILLRFRQGKIVICADIVKMYRQILVNESQLRFQTILWRPDLSSELKAFQLRTVTYGTASAPWLAERCLKQLANDFSDKRPRAAQILDKDFYVDDLLTSCNSEEEAIQICNDLSFILHSGGFQLQKWASNSKQVLEHVKAENQDAIFKIGEKEGTKTLGLVWCFSSDHLKYMINVPSFNGPLTKRSVLSDIAQIFDPLGLLGPCIVRGKIFLQSLWLHKLHWDESLPSHLHSQWLKFREQLPILNSLRVPRHALLHQCCDVEIHGFSDASIEAYGACIYLRSISTSGMTEVSLLCSKTKVAPLKSLTIPKLELCGALLLVRLLTKVKGALTISFSKVFLWCDSKVCLAWIQTPPNKLQTFVQNRVAQIQEATSPKEWCYVRTSQNPADLLSRGTHPQVLSDSKLWWHGPDWLVEPKTKWPCTSFKYTDDLPEVKKQKVVLSVFQREPLLDIHKFSSFTKLQRVIAYVQRFISNCKTRAVDRKLDPLGPNELTSAEHFLVKVAQGESFSDEAEALYKNKPINKKSKLLSLNPFLDEKGIIRVGGRLQLSSFEFDTKHPVVMSSKHYLTKLLFIYEHLRLHHAGPQQLLFSIRQRFWPLSGKNLAKQVVHSCIRCFKCKPANHATIMGSLPKPRVTPAYPFNTTGVDYAGPVLIKTKAGKGAKICKAYIALFICFATKAVHIELVSDLTKEAFIAAFRRFVSRRGKPQEMYSDNGTNFVGAHSELHELSKFLKTNNVELQESISNTGVTWKFIPAFSPHFGGLWEAGVKSAKKHLIRVIGNAKLTFEELYTVLVEIEAILNSRPLTPISSDPSDLSPLTPAHFLLGREATSLPDPDVRDVPLTRLSRFQHLQNIQQHFWSRWAKEYVTELQTRTKWKTQRPGLQVGSLVVIKSDSTPPLQWKLGRIIKLHPGLDGVTRVVSIQTTNGVVKRACSKVCVLPIENPDTEKKGEEDSANEETKM